MSRSADDFKTRLRRILIVVSKDLGCQLFSRPFYCVLPEEVEGMDIQDYVAGLPGLLANL